MKSPRSINNKEDLDSSTAVLLAEFDDNPETALYDGILVACYSVHPLVKELSTRFEGRALVTGIFEASILTSLSLVPPYLTESSESQTWGIVTTGSFWERHLADGVKAFLGLRYNSESSKFAGAFSTGLHADDFHGDIPPEVIRDKLKGAARDLLENDAVGCVVMGCAGMAGLDQIIRETAVEVYGQERGRRVCIVDGVKAGILLLDRMIRDRKMFT